MARFFFNAESGWIERDGHPIMRVFRNAPGMGFYHGLPEAEVLALGKRTADLLNGETVERQTVLDALHQHLAYPTEACAIVRSLPA